MNLTDLNFLHFVGIGDPWEIPASIILAIILISIVFIIYAHLTDFSALKALFSYTAMFAVICFLIWTFMGLGFLMDAGKSRRTGEQLWALGYRYETPTSRFQKPAYIRYDKTAKRCWNCEVNYRMSKYD